MKPGAITSLLADFWSDVNDVGDPGLLWQVLTLLACLAAGSAIARLLRAALLSQQARQQQGDDAKSMIKLGVGSFSRVLSPMLGLFLIELARPWLARYH
ncbi:MAG TPA: hypothetical protein VF798_16700, partial [Burkholderiaceae bacterium]